MRALALKRLWIAPRRVSSRKVSPSISRSFRRVFFFFKLFGRTIESVCVWKRGLAGHATTFVRLSSTRFGIQRSLDRATSVCGTGAAGPAHLSAAVRTRAMCTAFGIPDLRFETRSRMTNPLLQAFTALSHLERRSAKSASHTRDLSIAPESERDQETASCQVRARGRDDRGVLAER